MYVNVYAFVYEPDENYWIQRKIITKTLDKIYISHKTNIKVQRKYSNITRKKKIQDVRSFSCLDVSRNQFCGYYFQLPMKTTELFRLLNIL